MNDDINPGTCAPTGVDRNNTAAISANTTAPPGTRAFAQMYEGGFKERSQHPV